MKCCVVNSSVSNAAKSLQLLLFTHCMIVEMLKLGPPCLVARERVSERNDGLRGCPQRWRRGSLRETMVPTIQVYDDDGLYNL